MSLILSRANLSDGVTSLFGAGFGGDISNTGLRAWYRFDSGDPFTDKTGNLNDLTNSNTTTTATNALFSSSLNIEYSQFAYINDTSKMALSGAHTHSIWVRPDALGDSGADSIIFDKRLTSPQGGYVLLVSPTGIVKYYLYTTGGFKYGFSTNTIAIDTWSNLIARWSGVTTEGIDIFINGSKETLSTEVNNTGTIVNSTTRFTFGRRFGETLNEFDSLIDDYRLYDRALSDAEISNIYNYSEFYLQGAYQEVTVNSAINASFSGGVLGNTVNVYSREGSANAMITEPSSARFIGVPGLKMGLYLR